MKKYFYTLAGILLLFLFLGLANRWHEQAWQNPLPQNNLEPIGASENDQNDYQEFIAPDNNFRIDYPADWFRIEDEKILSAFNNKEWGERYALKTILVVQNLQGGKFAQLIVQEGIFDIGAEEILQKMEESNEQQHLKMEVVKSDIEDDKEVFETRYLPTSGDPLYSKEMILLGKDKGYLIAFSTLEKDWQEFSNQADSVINSAQLIMSQ